MGAAVLSLQICAVGVFLISDQASIASTVVALGLMAFLAEMRGIPSVDIQSERELSDEQIEQMYQRSNRRR